MSGDRYEAGLAMRRRVLGDAHVDRSMSPADPLTAEMQRLVVEVGWGTVWTRPGLSLRDRSLANIGMLAALGRTEELRAHTLGALRNGITREELLELVVQSAIYCGFPAALDAMRAVRQALAEADAHPELLAGSAAAP